MLCGRSAATLYCDTCAGRGPQDSAALINTFQTIWRCPVAVLVRSRLGRRRGDAARRALACTTATPGPHCSARAARSVGRYTMVRYALGTRAMGFARADQGLAHLSPPTCRGICAVEPRLAVWGWRLPRVGPQPSQAKCAAGCVLPAPSAATRRCNTRAGRVLRDANELIKSFEPPAAVRSRCCCGRASTDGVGMKRSGGGSQHTHAKSTLCGPCSAVRWPLLHSATCARDVGHKIRLRWLRPLIPFGEPVAVLVRYRLGRRRGDGAPCVGLHHNHAKSGLQGARSVLRRPLTTALRDVRGTRATKFKRTDQYLMNHPPPTGRGIGAVAPRLAVWGRARRALAHIATTPQVRALRPALCGRSAHSPRGETRAGHTSWCSNAMARIPQRTCY